MNSNQVFEQSLLITALTLRRVVGILGIAFPFVMVAGNALFGARRIQSSISAYYYTDMRNVFVGLLCTIGVFLLCYRGYEIKDRVAALAAGAGSIGTALVPTAFSAQPMGMEKILGIVHWTFAAAFLLSLTYMSVVLFRMTGGQPTPQKLRRNTVYLACGLTMAACLALLLIYSVLPAHAGNRLAAFDPVFWLESIAVVSFGFSWLTKGEALFGDES